MTYQPDFSECWAKLDRAREHRDALEKEILPLISAERYPITLSVEFDLQSGEHILRVAKLPTLPLVSLGLVLGECVHNLRCVLDYLVWQLALHKCEGVEPADAEKVLFPLWTKQPKKMKRPKDFAKESRLKDVLPAHRAVIEGFQPYNLYKRSNLATHPLAILAVLSNRDKHQLLNKMLAVSRELHVRWRCLKACGPSQPADSPPSATWKSAQSTRACHSPKDSRVMWKWQAMRPSIYASHKGSQ